MEKDINDIEIARLKLDCIRVASDFYGRRIHNNYYSSEVLKFGEEIFKTIYNDKDEDNDLRSTACKK